MFATCSRKDFIHLVAGTGVLTLIGCSSGDDDASPGSQAGTGGTGTGGTSTSGTSTGGTTTSMAGTGGTGTGGTGGSSATGGLGGSGGTGVAGSSTGGGAGHAASGGASGSTGAAAGSGGTGQGGVVGTSGSSAGGRVGSGGATTGGSGGVVSGAGAAGKAGAGGMSTGGMGGSAGSGGGSMCTTEITAQISMNHGHTLSVPVADVMAGVAKIYNARGTATHDHYVQVTAADFSVLKTGGTIKKVACNGGDHEFVLSCGTASEQAGDPKCSSSDMCASSMSMLCPDPT